jgi:hypothetical protein
VNSRETTYIADGDKKQMTRNGTIAAVLSLAALGVSAELPVIAAPPSSHIGGFAGGSNSSVAGCPALMWRLALHDDGTLTGIVYYSDLSGLSMAKGSMDKSGHFHLQLTSAMGDGPVATVDGEKPQKGSGYGYATMTGQGCANMHMQLTPVQNMKRAPTASQMG